MKKEQKKDLQLVYGVHPIVELLKAKKRRLVTIYTTKSLPKGWQQISANKLPKHTSIQYVSKEALTKLAGSADHQGVVGLATNFPAKKNIFSPAQAPFLLLLDGIQDPRNLGAILRSAYCTGVDGVVIPKKHSATITPTVLKSSAGLAEHLDIYFASSSVWAAQQLSDLGYNLYLGMLSKDAKDATSIKYQMPLCLVIGNEAQGVSKSLERFGQSVKLPQKDADVSYNASVAAGIMLFSIASLCDKI